MSEAYSRQWVVQSSLRVATATASQGYKSESSRYSGLLIQHDSKQGNDYIFRWQAEPVENNTTSTSATLNLLYGVTGNLTETGISVNNKGILQPPLPARHSPDTGNRNGDEHQHRDWTEWRNHHQ